MAELTTEQLDLVRDFVTALRSGEYAQGRQRLSGIVDEKKVYCCEGVALERYGVSLGYSVSRSDEGALRGRDPLAEGSIGSCYNAPQRFWYDMGLSPDPRRGFIFEAPERNGERSAYADLNDTGLTFDQIADLIEWQFLPNTEVNA